MAKNINSLRQAIEDINSGDLFCPQCKSSIVLATQTDEDAINFKCQWCGYEWNEPAEK